MDSPHVFDDRLGGFLDPRKMKFVGLVLAEDFGVATQRVAHLHVELHPLFHREHAVVQIVDQRVKVETGPGFRAVASVTLLAVSVVLDGRRDVDAAIFIQPVDETVFFPPPCPASPWVCGLRGFHDIVVEDNSKIGHVLVFGVSHFFKRDHPLDLAGCDFDLVALLGDITLDVTSGRKRKLITLHRIVLSIGDFVGSIGCHCAFTVWSSILALVGVVVSLDGHALAFLDPIGNAVAIDGTVFFVFVWHGYSINRSRSLV